MRQPPCQRRETARGSLFLGNAAASFGDVRSLWFCSACSPVAATESNRCLTHEIHRCCQQTTHSSTLTADTAPNSRSAHRRKHRCLRQHALLPAPASPGAFLQDRPCPTGFRSKCNTTSVLPESLRRTPTHLLRHGSGKHCWRKPNAVDGACTSRSPCVCARFVTATGRL